VHEDLYRRSQFPFSAIIESSFQVTKPGEQNMSPSSRIAPNAGVLFVALILLYAAPRVVAEPLPLKRAVELALAHSTVTAAARPMSNVSSLRIARPETNTSPSSWWVQGWASPGAFR
jgi:hypothetical protein